MKITKSKLVEVIAEEVQFYLRNEMKGPYSKMMKQHAMGQAYRDYQSQKDPEEDEEERARKEKEFRKAHQDQYKSKKGLPDWMVETLNEEVADEEYWQNVSDILSDHASELETKGNNKHAAKIRSVEDALDMTGTERDENFWKVILMALKTVAVELYHEEGDEKQAFYIDHLVGSMLRRLEKQGLMEAFEGDEEMDDLLSQRPSRRELLGDSVADVLEDALTGYLGEMNLDPGVLKNIVFDVEEKLLDVAVTVSHAVARHSNFDQDEVTEGGKGKLSGKGIDYDMATNTGKYPDVTRPRGRKFAKRHVAKQRRRDAKSSLRKSEY